MKSNLRHDTPNFDHPETFESFTLFHDIFLMLFLTTTINTASFEFFQKYFVEM